jgi:tetratricopeptide (TPR) repeat protein
VRRLALLAVSALVLHGPALAGEGDEAPEPSGLEQAVKRFEAGEFEEAARIAAEVPADAPLHARSRYLLGEIALILDDAATAEARFREALEKKPGAEPVLTGIGRALLRQDKAEDAVAVLEKAVAADAKSARARAFLGLARARSGARDAGRKDLAAASKLDPADPEVARVVVEERIDAEDLAGAGKAANAIAKAAKDHAMGPFLQALVLDRSRKWDEAIAGYEKALKLDPSFLDAHKNLGILCIAENPLYQDRVRTKKGMEHMGRYLELGGKDPEIRRIHGTLESFLKSQGG